MAYVRQSLFKSGEYPINIYGDSKEAYKHFDPSVSCGDSCCEFLPAVISHAERWRHVSLGVRSPRFPPPVTTFSSLRSVELYSSGDSAIDEGFLLLLNGANAPHLREVQLQSTQILRWDLISLPQSLSRLKIQDIFRVQPSANRWLSILATCPNLAVLRLCKIIGRQQEEEGGQSGHANIPAVVELTALQELELIDIPSCHMRELLQRLSISDECTVSVRYRANYSSLYTSSLTPALSHHRGSFEPAKVTIIFFRNLFSLFVVGQRWYIKLGLQAGDDVRDALEWFNISTANSSNASSGSGTLQPGSTAPNISPVTMKLVKPIKSSTFTFDARVSHLQCISRIEIDGLSFFWYLSGPEDPNQPSITADYYAFDNPGPKTQTTGVWPFPGVCELALKVTEAQATHALLDAIKMRSSDDATAEASGMPAHPKRIEFVDGDEPTERGDNYLKIDANDTERLVLDILDALDDDAELWWRGKRISKA